MRTTNYSDILRSTGALAGLAASDLDPAGTIFADLRTLHDRRFEFAWTAERWPDVCVIERRSFRAPWSASATYKAGDEVLDPATLTYFVALTASTGQAPTTGGVVNKTFWASVAATFTGNDWSATQTYAVGDVVRNPADDQYYQLLMTDIQVSGAGVAAANGIYRQVGPYMGRESYVTDDNGYVIYWAGGQIGVSDGWIIYANGGNALYKSESDVATPDLATNWFAVDGSQNPNPANNPTPKVTVCGQVKQPPATDIMGNPYWALRTPFQRYVAYNQTLADGTALTPIGEVLAAWDRDPRITSKISPLPFLLTADGANFRLLRHNPAYVWLLFRPQRTRLTGEAWSASAVYASGRQVYFVTPTGAGNFYTAAATTNAGESPATAPAKWTVVAIPAIFHDYLAQGGYADWLTNDGQTDKAAAAEATALALLEREADKLHRQQGQAGRFSFQ